jgi:hypothetical protein
MAILVAPAGESADDGANDETARVGGGEIPGVGVTDNDEYNEIPGVAQAHPDEDDD